MTSQSLSIDLPEATYQRLQERAQQTHRTIQETAREVLVGAVEQADTPPADLEVVLMSLTLLTDAELWLAARTRMPEDAAAQLADLNLKRQREGLDEDEARSAKALLHLYERTMLVRAQAAVFLQQRGHDISRLRQIA